MGPTVRHEVPEVPTGAEQTHPNAAGIDIGSAAHFVAVPPDRDDEPVREFASLTVDLERLAEWLAACGVDTVAMESTGKFDPQWSGHAAKVYREHAITLDLTILCRHLDCDDRASL